jgi:hypothetical protein
VLRGRGREKQGWERTLMKKKALKGVKMCVVDAC